MRLCDFEYIYGLPARPPRRALMPFVSKLENSSRSTNGPPYGRETAIIGTFLQEIPDFNTRPRLLTTIQSVEFSDE